MTVPTLTDLVLELRTPRLALRPIAECDVDALWPLCRDPELPRWMSWRPHADRADTLAYVRMEQAALADNSAVVWVIAAPELVVGTIGLRRIQWQLRTWRVERAELGYWIAREHWNRGLTTEAARAVVRFGFATLGLHKITSGCLADNVASRRVLEKLGFTACGVHRADVWLDGAWRDDLRYELLASAWDPKGEGASPHDDP